MRRKTITAMRTKDMRKRRTRKKTRRMTKRRRKQNNSSILIIKTKTTSIKGSEYISHRIGCTRSPQRSSQPPRVALELESRPHTVMAGPVIMLDLP